VLYLVWGSTYLAIRIAIETIPPLLMAGVRMLIAGGILATYAWLRGAPMPTRNEWRSVAIVGTFLLLGGNGLVVWAAQKLPSGLLALLVGATPLSMVLVGWLAGADGPPRPLTMVALVMGMAGLGWLMMPRGTQELHVDLLSALAALGATLGWAIGSHQARRAQLPRSKSLTIGLEMLVGGVELCLAGLLLGELARLRLGEMSWQSLAALAYLIVFGSLIGFSSYIYLLEHTRPALATSYAFVNPLVAVALGWAIRNEPIGLRVLGGGALIVLAVVLITLDRARTQELAPEKEIEVT
jgi:drug/metabolite transporter (DMT)-like permease